MANIAQVVNLSVATGGGLLQEDNPNVVMLITSQAGVLSSTKRHNSYLSVSDVAADFGTASEVYKQASIVFAQSPNPVQAGGRLVIGYWRGAAESVAASAGKLTGQQLSEATTISELQKITDGSAKISIDGTAKTLTGLNFSTVTTMAEVVSLLAIAGAVVSYDDQRIIITSATTGASSSVSLMTAHTTGTFIGSLLGLGNGATITAGAAAATLAVETKLAAVAALKSQVNFKGFVFLDNPTDAESKDLATWAQANGVMGYDVFSSPSNLSVDGGNVVWQIKLANESNYRMFYSPTGSRSHAVAAMARVHTVNFDGENTATTLNLKEFTGVVSDNLSDDVISKAKTVGMSVYVPFKGGQVSKVLESGANDYADNRYNLLALSDAIQTSLFNLLAGTSTKIAQTEAGVALEIDTLNSVGARFARAGVMAAGTWSSPDTIGNPEQMKRAISALGYFFVAGSLATQTQANREARKSPALQGAFKLAGAIHSADVIININK